MTNENEIIREALDTFGTMRQVDVAIEECAELIVALEHFKRGRCCADYSDIVTEIADVQIICSQMQMLFGSVEVLVEKERKLERLKERVHRFNAENNKHIQR